MSFCFAGKNTLAISFMSNMILIISRFTKSPESEIALSLISPFIRKFQKVVRSCSTVTAAVGPRHGWIGYYFIHWNYTPSKKKSNYRYYYCCQQRCWLFYPFYCFIYVYWIKKMSDHSSIAPRFIAVCLPVKGLLSIQTGEVSYLVLIIISCSTC